MKTIALCVWLGLMLAMGMAGAQELVMIAPTNHAMPWAKFKDGVLTDGILKELGEAIAARTGRHARFIDLPSKRVASELALGHGDGVCYVLPSWIAGDFNWTGPLIPTGGLIVAHPDAPVLTDLGRLAGEPIGTVIGYHYPQLDQALGSHFMRDDAPSMEHNVRKLAAGRRHYAIVEATTLAYLMRIDKSLRLRTDLVIATFKAKCAFSKRAQVPFAQVERAIAGLVADGSVERILSHYR